MNKELNNIILDANNCLNAESTVAIFGHINPDGDALGSTLAMYHYLKSRVKEVNVVMPNNFPDFLSWLPQSEDVIIFSKNKSKAIEKINEANVLIICDFNDPKRTNDDISLLLQSKDKVKIMVDHHPLPVNFVDHMISDTSVSSTCELIFEFISKIEGDDMSGKDIAQCLLTGIITDTGMFHHNSENTRTFEIVSKLLLMGANKKEIVNKLYNEYPHSRMQLLGNTLHNRLQFLPEFGTSYIYISKEDQQIFNYKDGDSEGFVNIALSLKGANFSAIFIEKDELVKASFRSLGNFDVNQFARKHFNGGGHRNAAGGKCYKSLNKTLEHFVNLLSEYKDDILNS